MTKDKGPCTSRGEQTTWGRSRDPGQRKHSSGVRGPVWEGEPAAWQKLGTGEGGRTFRESVWDLCVKKEPWVSHLGLSGGLFPHIPFQQQQQLLAGPAWLSLLWLLLELQGEVAEVGGRGTPLLSNQRLYLCGGIGGGPGTVCRGQGRQGDSKGTEWTKLKAPSRILLMMVTEERCTCHSTC